MAEGIAGNQYGSEEAGIRTADDLHAGKANGRRGMSAKDEIVEEVRAAREVHAARFNYNLAEMFKDLKAKEHDYNRNIALLQPLEPQPGIAIPR
jgi:hypothetical protein